MKWYVKYRNQIMGWVIASTEEEAIKLAYNKYPNCSFEPYEVILRKNK